MLGLGLVAKLPRFFILTFLLITIFLLTFLLLGCTSNSDSYSNVYVISFSYNEKSALYPRIREGYEVHNTSSNYWSMQIRSGFLGICASIGSQATCAPLSNLTALQQFTGLDIYQNNTSANSTVGSLNPLMLGTTFSKSVINPFPLYFSIFFTVMAFLTTIWCCLVNSSNRLLQNRISFGFLIASWASWMFASIWIQVATNSATRVISLSSLGVLVGTVGVRAAAMTWTSLAFLFLSLGLGILQYARELALNKSKDNEVKA